MRMLCCRQTHHVVPPSLPQHSALNTSAPVKITKETTCSHWERGTLRPKPWPPWARCANFLFCVKVSVPAGKASHCDPSRSHPEKEAQCTSTPRLVCPPGERHTTTQAVATLGKRHKVLLRQDPCARREERRPTPQAAATLGKRRKVLLPKD